MGLRSAILLLSLVAPWAPAVEANFNVMLGPKLLDEDDWDPVEWQALLGVQVDIRPEGWPVAIAVNMLGSSDYDRRTVMNVGTVVATSATFPGCMPEGLGSQREAITAILRDDLKKIVEGGLEAVR